MIRKILLVLITLYTFYIICNVFFYDFTSSTIPGWHTTLLPAYISLAILAFPWLIFIAICYGIFLRKKVLDRRVILLYLVLTLPLPTLVIITNNFDAINLSPQIDLIIKLTAISISLFLIGQLTFIWYLLEMTKRKS
ncbi:hypothetical protein Q766_07375 [Flavobacterium subsaxonicum WB 4.1-42 = DSM 21790]|uniref:Uncharacterized protein n=1 Tax=Flavobacterium subsaxonicum WB 4.1-42 = DSM 21790 TaxID=1121898 RepID=A0A0A2MQN5_9FLAO|nr:hypothetical protein Q766_07375 [Flavobacterium subsaxonicum WB 4.1-42 = DSM 21790]